MGEAFGSRQNAREKQITKRVKIPSAIEVMENLHPRSFPNPVQWPCCAPVLSLDEVTDEQQSRDKIIERSGCIQEPRLTWNHEFRNSGDSRREHHFSVRHCLH